MPEKMKIDISWIHATQDVNFSKAQEQFYLACNALVETLNEGEYEGGDIEVNYTKLRFDVLNLRSAVVKMGCIRIDGKPAYLDNLNNSIAQFEH